MLRAVRRAARSAASRANAEALTTRAMAIARGEDATRTVTVARTVTRAHATTAPTIPSKPSQPVQTKRPGKLPSDAAVLLVGTFVTKEQNVVNVVVSIVSSRQCRRIDRVIAFRARVSRL